MDNTYVYDWLDKQSSYELNPALVYPGTIGDRETETLFALITQEIERVEKQLKVLFFNERKKEQVSLLVHRYQNMLVVMMDKVYHHLQHPHCHITGLTDILSFLQEKLEGLLQYFEQHFASYIIGELHVPRQRLIKAKRELMERWESLQSHVQGKFSGSINVVHQVLLTFISRIDQQKDITIREVKYHKQLMIDLLNNCESEALIKEMLIFRNLNGKESTCYFAKQIDLVLGRLESAEAKLSWLRLEYKTMQHRRVSKKMIYDPLYPSLKQYLCSYMENEMLYLEQKLEGIQPIDEQQKEMTNFKVMCNLSTDQIAVLLRAADDTRLLIARSMNTVFKTIVPFLSTPKKKDVSWQSVRTKGYDVEQTDKDKVISKLEDMIKRIRDY